ncbi:lysine N(6)-hydroxylase/L-ornithine N(5)-oxygenase family protein [Nocardia pseudobrasiliensis]|uniref:L-lysine N6-monooxygenase MbtG n=1 Tax=Nocardia pseudobrasiliensis TaxID=45979 RepID=A0A370ID20_9NOCA|nr:SidA/IucD/PvdA family monooxygenase [Nocardia pseudobrasiliensis]RDI68632.1 lysine N6-hydroxylase [Nocardia pseudobrasiliensis]
MSQESLTDNCEHYRCVGIGIGPANLSLASLLYGQPDMSNRFFEKRNDFRWHDGQLLPDTSLQVSMLKDLVSLSDPTNRFSFLSYLHAQGRVYHYLNAQFDAVPRSEFRNYLEWVSANNENLMFGEEVQAIQFDRVFVLRTGNRTVTADNIVIGVGRRPHVPPMAEGLLGPTQFHIGEFADRAVGLGGRRVWVIGGGQSGAEAFLDLISRPRGELPRRVGWISRRRNYFPLDDSPFTNDYYMPDYSEYFSALPGVTRDKLNSAHVLSSDGISESTLRKIYQRIYLHHFVDGATDLVALYPNRDVLGVTGDSGAGWDITLTHNDQPGADEHVEADVIVWATGFHAADTEFLSPIEERLERDGDEYKIDSDFAVRWDGPADRNIFLQNGARRQRGLADTNLSLVAWRSKRIADRLRGIRSDDPHGSFLEWSAKGPDDRLSGA